MLGKGQEESPIPRLHHTIEQILAKLRDASVS